MDSHGRHIKKRARSDCRRHRTAKRGLKRYIVQRRQIPGYLEYETLLGDKTGACRGTDREHGIREVLAIVSVDTGACLPFKSKNVKLEKLVWSNSGEPYSCLSVA